MREKCLYLKFFWFVFSPNAGKYGPEKLRIRKLFKFHVWHVNVYFTEQNIMHREGLIELNFEGIKIEKRNVPTDRAQRIDKKNWAIFLSIRFIPTVIFIKMSKMGHFLYFLLMIAKNLSQLRQNIQMHLKDLIYFFQKMV